MSTCIDCGLRIARGTRCVTHAREYQRNRRGGLNGWQWQWLRGQIIRRDAGCVVCGTTLNLEVDHIRALADGGSNDPSNLRVLCREHHQERHRPKVRKAQ